MSEGYDRVEITTRAGWRRWLERNHATAHGVWAVTNKKDSGKPYVAYADLVEEALCFGWIDSVRRSVDAQSSRLLMTPRKAGSKWSKLNKDRIARLRAAGLLAPAGLAAVERAEADGTWAALDAVEALEEPADLQAALDAQPRARAEWDAFPRSAKRAILEWIGNAKRPETRAARVTETAEKASTGVRANQWRQPGARNRA